MSSSIKSHIIIKSSSQQEKMKEVGLKLGSVFDKLSKDIKPGISTYDVAELANKYILESGCKPTFKGYSGFPGYICTSVNEILIHGIPSKRDILKDGDIISLDIGNVDSSKFQGDACRTFAVGNISDEAKKLIRCTEECFYEAFKVCKPGARLYEISLAIQKVADKYGYSLVKEYGGHGLGMEMHEDPFIYNYYDPSLGLGPILKEGMTLAIEPMVMSGKNKIEILNDGWGVISRDRKINCHYENDIIITSTGAIITSVDENVKRHLKELEEER